MLMVTGSVVQITRWSEQFASPFHGGTTRAKVYWKHLRQMPQVPPSAFPSKVSAPQTIGKEACFLSSRARGVAQAFMPV